MKYIFLALFLAPLFVKAQSLMVGGETPNLYLTHKVGPKENFYSVGRLYNISPKEIAPYNKINLETGLTLGQVIKIPLVPSNFSQNGVVPSDELSVPVYYVIKEKETLYHVSLVNNKLPLIYLKDWNKLTVDALKGGRKLIIGWLKVKENSPLSARAIKIGAADKKDVVVKEPKVVKPKAPPVEVKNEPTEETKPPAVEKKVATKKEKKLIADSLAATKPIKEKVTDSLKDVAKKDKKKTKADAKTKKVKEKLASDDNITGGIFKNLYNPVNNPEEKGRAGIFKSSSGWSDGKYYCLYNAAPAGTVIKISNEAGKSIYAKVLDYIPNIKQSGDLILLVSNAAAQELGINTDTFTCTINF